MTKRLKNYAMKFEMPIILLSQLSRVSEKEDREPKLSDLRESGNIEQDADIVIFIHNDQLIIAKNRNGKTGKIKIEFEKKYFRFESNNNKFDEDFEYQGKMDYIHD